MPEFLHVLESGASESAYNMALDEALLLNVSRIGSAILRFYGWAEPAATFGYFQKISDVESLTPLRPLIRRPTGGGIVPHDHDWTYSVAISPDSAWYGLRAIESYRRIHEWIRAAFNAMGIETALAPEALLTGPGQCFAGYERFDLLFGGRKVAGAAQRRTKSGLLIQGSVHSPRPDLNRLQWHQAMLLSAQRQSFQSSKWNLDSATSSMAAELRDKKYSKIDYNRKR
jgi:lipoate-protein ligase A